MTYETYAAAKRHQDEIHDLMQIKSQLTEGIDGLLENIRYENNKQGQFDYLELSLRVHVNDYFAALIKNEDIEFNKIRESESHDE